MYSKLLDYFTVFKFLLGISNNKPLLLIFLGLTTLQNFFLSPHPPFSCQFYIPNISKFYLILSIHRFFGIHSTAALRFTESDLIITYRNHQILCAFKKFVILRSLVISQISLFLHLRRFSLSYTGLQMVFSILISNDISFCFIRLVIVEVSHPYIIVYLIIAL